MKVEYEFEYDPVTGGKVDVYTISEGTVRAFIDGERGRVYLEMLYDEPREILVTFRVGDYSVSVWLQMGLLDDVVMYVIRVSRDYGRAVRRVEVSGTLAGRAADELVNQVLTLAEHVLRR